MLAVLAAVVVCGGLLTVTQVAGASTWRRWGGQKPPTSACPPANGGGATQSGTASPTSSASKKNGTQVTTQNGRQVRQWGDDDNPNQRINRGNRNPRPNCTTPATASASPSSSSTTPPLDIQATSCEESNKQRHTGFQEDAERCVATDHGEVGQLSRNPTALIVQFPQGGVRVGEAFQVVISTRNIIRDRFLAAAQGGYYAEMDQLAANGLARGHAHFACNVLPNTNEAPAPSRSQFFVAIEDSAGSATPDRITVNVTGLATAGTASCALWLGGQSHRVPMMAFANQVPGFDAVRFQVRA